MISILPLLLNIVLIYFDLKIKSVFSAFSIATLIVFSIPHFIFSLYVESFEDYVYQYVTLHSIIFFLVLLVVRLTFIHLFKINTKDDIVFNNERNINSQFNISFFCLLLFLILSFSAFDFSFTKAFSYSWNNFRDSGSKLTLIGSFFLYSGSSFLLLAMKKKSKIGFLLIILLVLYIVLILKTRNFLVAISVPYVIYFILSDKIGLKKIFTGFMIGIVIFTLYSGARSIRHLGSIDEISTQQNIEFNIDSGEFELINTLYYFVDKGGVKLDYNNVTLIRLIMLPIPSIIMPFNKPKELSHILWDQKTGVKGVSGSLHPTVIGDSILNSFYFGSTLYGFFYGVLFFVLDKWQRISKYKALSFGLLCTVSFYIARGAVYNGIVILVVGFLILSCFSFMSKVKMKI